MTKTNAMFGVCLVAILGCHGKPLFLSSSSSTPSAKVGNLLSSTDGRCRVSVSMVGDVKVSSESELVAPKPRARVSVEFTTPFPFSIFHQSDYAAEPVRLNLRGAPMRSFGKNFLIERPGTNFFSVRDADGGRAACSAGVSISRTNAVSAPPACQISLSKNSLAFGEPLEVSFSTVGASAIVFLGTVNQASIFSVTFVPRTLGEQLLTATAVGAGGLSVCQAPYRVTTAP